MNDLSDMEQYDALRDVLDAQCPARCLGRTGHAGPHQTEDYVPPADRDALCICRGGYPRAGRHMQECETYADGYAAGLAAAPAPPEVDYWRQRALDAESQTRIRDEQMAAEPPALGAERLSEDFDVFLMYGSGLLVGQDKLLRLFMDEGLKLSRAIKSGEYARLASKDGA